MSNPTSRSTLVDIPTIERELNGLWEKMTEASSDEPVMRACVMNLLVYAGSEDSLREVSQVMAEITTDHPSRVVVMVAPRDGVHFPLDATVTVRCQLAERGRKQICCEQIVLKVAREEISYLPSLVRPLVIPDLPVFLWWRHAPNLQSTLFTRLVDTSDRVIIDSAQFSQGENDFPPLAALIKQKARRTVFSDLQWCQLTPWRVMIALIFDVPEYQSYLGRLDRVEITCAGQSSRSIPSQALLAAGWLSSRLKWQPTSGRHWIDEHTCRWQLKSENQTRIIQIKLSPSKATADDRLHSLQLIADKEPPARFRTFVDPDNKHLEAEVTVGVRKLTRKIIRLDDDEARLIRGELEILGHDEVYEKALGVLAELWN